LLFNANSAIFQLYQQSAILATISWLEQVNCQRHDDKVRFVLDQRA